MEALPSCELKTFLYFIFLHFGELLFFSDSPACSFIYADLCDSFSPTVHLTSFSGPGWLINRRGISVDFPNVLHKCPSYAQKSCYNAHAKPLHEQKHHSPK